MPTDYDALLSGPAPGAAPASTPDKYDTLMDGYVNLRQQQAKATTATAIDSNPDKYAAARRSAGLMGYPVGVAEALPEQVEREAKLKTISTDSAASPTMLRKYSDVDFAKLAHDDSGVLSSIAAAAKYMASARDTDGTTPKAGLMGDVQAGYNQAQGGAAGVFRAVSDMAASPFDFLEGATAIGGNPLRRLADGFADIAQKQLANSQANGSRFESDFGQGIASGVQSFTGNSLMLPLALIPGGEAPALYAMSAQQGGTSYQKAREKGVGQWQSLSYGLSDAVVEYATEKIPLHNLIGGVKAGAPVLSTFLKTAAAEVPGEQIATVLQDMNEWATLNPDKPFSSYIAERPSAAAQTLVATLVGTGGNVTISHAMQKVSDNAMGIERAQTAGIGLQQLLALAAQSKLRERSPEQFADTVNGMAADAKAPTEVRFDARTLAGVLSQSEINTLLPSAADQMQEALATGGEVTVPIGEFAANVIDTPAQQLLQEHARLGENELSQAEAREASKQTEQFLQEHAQQVVEQGQQAGAQQVAADQVRTTILDQLNTANRFTPQVNGAYATLAGSFYSTMAQRLGITADQLYERFPLKVEAQLESGSVSGNTLSGEGDDQTVVAQTFKDSAGWNTQSLADVFIGHPGSTKGDGSISVPSFATMLAHVRGVASDDSKVLDTIIESVPVDVVNNLFGSESAAKVALHHHPMFKDGSAIDAELPVASGGQASDPVLLLLREAAGKAAENADGTVARRGSAENIPASGANESGFSQGKSGHRAEYSPSRLTISLLERADLTSFLHELGHHFLELQTEIALQPNAPADVKADMDTLLKWWGVPDLQTWAGMTLDERRKHHEQFAESFEHYLIEGKAPTTDLQPLFARFRSWLTNVYKSLQNFLAVHNTQLSDEVRGVMDRMIATDAQIKQTEEARAYAPLFKSAEQAGMTPAAWAAYQAQGTKATEEALTQLQKRSLKDMRWLTGARSRALKALQKDAEVKRKAIETEVAAEVAKQPVYQAMRWLRKGEMTTPEGEEIKADKGFRLNTDALAEMYPDSALGNPELDRLKGMTAKNGMHPDLIAPMFGYKSGDELVRALADAQPQGSVVEGMTDQRMLERFGDLGTEAGMHRAADDAVHNEARGRFIATGLKALYDGMNQRERTPGGGSVNVMVRAAKDFASRLIGQRKVRELRIGQFTRAETRAGREALKAMAKNDTQAALVAQRDQLLNHYAAREAMRATAEVERGVDYLKKFDKASVRGKLPTEYLDQIDKLLERVDLRQVTNKEADKRAKLAAWLKSQEDLGIEPTIPDYLLEDSQLTPYREMTVDAFRGLVDTVKQIEHLGRLKDKLLTAKDAREFSAVIEDLKAQVLAAGQGRQADTRTPTTNLGRALQTMRNFGAAHIKAATWARIFDQGKDGGPFWERFIRPANERADQETTMRAKATSDLSQIMAPILSQKLHGSGTFYPSINRALNREGVLALALNTGNESNMQRLLGGEGWTQDQIQPVLDTLTSKEWGTVQAIWDYFETYRPQIGAMETRIFGREPNWVKPTERTVQTADGQTMTLRGGYYPIKYDPAASIKAEQHADAESAKRQLQNAYSAATVRKGFTKGRVEEVNGRPLLYSLKGVYDGINDVIHYLSWQEWLIDANRMLRNQGLDSAVRNTYGPAAVKQLRTWRDAVAEGESGSQEALDEALGKLRQSVSVAGLGFNVTSALMQPLGLTQSIVRVGARWVGKGLTQYIAAPVAMTKDVNEKSQFMESRARTRFRELNELRNKVQGQSSFKEYTGRYAYWLMMRAQQAVDVPTWLGGYEKAIADGNDEKRAIALADQVVKDSQGGGQTLDLSAIERGGPAQKMFTVFYSFMNTALNLGVTSKMTPGGKAKFAADMLLLYTVPAVLGALLKDAITPGDAGDGDDPDKLAKKLAGEQLSFLLGLVVVGREFGDAGKWLMTGERPTDYRGPAGLRAIGDAYQFGKQASQGEFDDGFRKALVNVSGDFFGLPSAQINRTITGSKAMADGDTKNPAALAMGFQKPH